MSHTLVFVSNVHSWNARKEPILDHYLLAVIDAAGSEHDEAGLYGALVYAGCDTRERAYEIKNALHRSARHLKVSVSCKIKREKDETYSVTFSVYNKDFARAYVIAKHGEDRSQWPYDPRKKKVAS